MLSVNRLTVRSGFVELVILIWFIHSACSYEKMHFGRIITFFCVFHRKLTHPCTGAGKSHDPGRTLQADDVSAE